MGKVEKDTEQKGNSNYFRERTGVFFLNFVFFTSPCILYRVVIMYILKVFLLCVHECFTPTYACAPHVCLVPEEFSRGPWIPWNAVTGDCKPPRGVGN